MGKNNYEYIKRGDFLVRNLKNLEVEVKCFTAKKDKNGNRYYTIKYKELKGLETLMKKLQTSICIAIFEREGRTFKPYSLGMVSLKDIMKKRNGIIYLEKIKSMKIPESALLGNFSYLKTIKHIYQSKIKINHFDNTKLNYV